MSALLLLSEVKLRIALIKASKDLGAGPPLPQLPDLGASVPIQERIKRVQEFIESFEYNYTGRPFVQMKKSRGMAHICSVSKQLMQEALPIQCVEAVFLGVYLTAGMEQLERVPLSFKTKFLRGTVHQHIILALNYGGSWGAVGISRRPGLMNKDMCFPCLSSLVEEYRRSYEACFHKLLTIYIGLPFSHNLLTDDPIKWRATKVRVFDQDPQKVAGRIDNFECTMRSSRDHFLRTGSLPTTALDD